MPVNHLATYLRDHLAGAEAALEIIDHIEESHGNTEAGEVVRKMRNEILSDREELKVLMQQLGETSSSPRRFFGWLGEKTVEAKLKVDDPDDGELRLFESIELLTLGIEGKLGLWRVLDANKSRIPALANLEYPRLIQRATDQRAVLEPVRIEAAIGAFN